MNRQRKSLVLELVLGVVVFAAVVASAQEQRPKQPARAINISPPQILQLLLRESEEVAIQALARSSVTVNELDEYSVRNSFTLLHFAIFHNRKNLARALLERGVNPNRVSPYSTSLHEATVYGHEEMAALLIEFGADPNSLDVNEDTPLTTAVRLQRTRLVDLFLENGARIDITNKWEETPLAIGARSNSVNLVRHALDAGVSPDVRIGVKERPLVIWAAEGGAAETLQLLIESDADLDVPDAMGFYAIHEAAASYGGVESVRVLLDAGMPADMAHALTNWEPLHFAAVSGSAETVDELLKRGASVESRDVPGRSPLHLAVAAGREEIISLLVRNGASASARDIDGRTPFHWAAVSGDIGSFRALPLAEFDKAAVDRAGRTAIDYLKLSPDISREQQTELLKELLNGPPKNPKLSRMIAAVKSQHIRRIQYTIPHSFDGDAQEEHTGWTALHYAAAEGGSYVVKLLLDLGMSPNITDHAGRSPMHIAALLGHREIFDLMHEYGGELFVKDDAGLAAFQYFFVDPSQRRPVQYYQYVPDIYLDTPASQ